MIIGTTIEAIDAKKFEAHQGNWRIDHHTSIKKISEVKLPVFPKEKISKIDFEFTSKYFPSDDKKDKELGHIIITGHVLYKGMNSKQKAFWKKNKKLPDELAITIINHTMKKSILKAIDLAETLLLPVPVNLPTLTIKSSKKTEASYIG